MKFFMGVEGLKEDVFRKVVGVELIVGYFC